LIFITTGTSLPHDSLIRRIDDLKAMGILKDKIYAQIGHGKYIPNHMTWLRFVGNMEEVYKRADIIISTCGAGTIMENVTKGRKLIAVQNPGVTGGHEWELVSKMESLGCLVWCRDIEHIIVCINKARDKEFEKFVPDKFDTSLLYGLLRKD
jgi:UDP-N-acetylglucosamine transferase subunit ALG13